MPQPFHQLPASVLAISRSVRLAGGTVPALLVHPYFDRGSGKVLRPAPVLIWMHGRTVTKELDPGRYLRLARAGIATCAVDLPGHGERLDAPRQAPEQTLGVVEQMVNELDAVLADIDSSGEHTACKRALGGMSAGGMAALVRLTRPHSFDAAVVECTTGSWRWQQHRAMFDAARVAAMNPIDHLTDWREIPFLALHNSEDEWIPVDGQREFIEALRARAILPEHVQFHVYGPTGAPFEHAGFGRMASDAKERVTAFLTHSLTAAE
ncbi:MAG: alpha/beta fold hydrolase [Planctomycetota bacterium]